MLRLNDRNNYNDLSTGSMTGPEPLANTHDSLGRNTEFQSPVMTVTYFKRFKMQIDLNLVTDIELPQIEGYRFEKWESNLVARHAEAKFLSFKDELDSNVFPCLGNADGCKQLMNEISCRKGFVPEATWLLSIENQATGKTENCGTVQGIQANEQIGSIQNLGIVPQHRGHGLGSKLLMYSLKGFHSVGIKSVNLEVTAHNESALQLYQRVGFKITNVVYKSADLVY